MRQNLENSHQFHAILVPYVAGANRSIEFFENRNKLRFYMLELMNIARADLGRTAKDSPDASSSPMSV